MTSYICRIAVKTLSGWQHKVINVESYNIKSKNSSKVFHPLMLRFLATVIGIGGTDVGYENSNVWPTLVADFGQWNEIISVKCYISGEGDVDSAKFVDAVDRYSYLRRWLIRVQAVKDNKVYLQLFMTDVGDDVTPEVAFDPVDTPLGTVTGRGYRGMITGIDMDDHKAGTPAVSFTLTFQVGVVLPI